MWTARDRTRARGGDGARETNARAHLEASETVAPRASMVRGRRTSAGREVRRRAAAGRVATTFVSRRFGAHFSDYRDVRVI
jgi:hypothetical protein